MEDLEGCDCGYSDPHTCPFKEDMNGDDTECTCCEECTNNCAECV